jgi:hypothetical protein
MLLGTPSPSSAFPVHAKLSPYRPMTKEGGFVLSPNPMSGNMYTLGDGVFDFKRTRTK